MAIQQTSSFAPLTNPLPPPPAPNFYTEQQWTTLMSLMDTVIPSIHKEAAGAASDAHLTIPDSTYNAAIESLKGECRAALDSKLLDRYLNEKASDVPGFRDIVVRTLGTYTKDEERKLLGLVLSTLNTRAGSFLLTGHATPIHEQSLHMRTVILKGWSVSSIAPLKVIYQQMTVLAKNVWLKTSNPFFSVTGFPIIPKDYHPGTHYGYDFLQFEAGTSAEIIETDVIIVGSGCGGAVCAKNLAEGGHRVLVVDKSYYYPPSQLPMTQAEAGIHLFDNGGVDLTDDSSVSIVSGSSWGGGGTINWSASLQTQGYVRKEWAEDRNLPFFASSEFQNCLDRVCGRMGVGTDSIKHNHGNQVILEGARRLGYTAKAVPQNTGGADHNCGHCTLGCGGAEKQGPVVSWLPDAAKAGAKFAEGFKVERVLFEMHGGEKRAVGVEGSWTSRAGKAHPYGLANEGYSRKVIVKAKKVIISAGTLQSPMVLMRSGLKNYHIGRNLYLHPVEYVGGVYKEEVRPWEGPILTTVCTSFENLDNHGHGVKLETACMMPSWSLSLMNWNDGLSFKLQALKYPRTNVFIVVTRDRDTGRVYSDARGGTRIEYTPSKFDRAHTMVGVIALAKMIYATDAEEINICIAGIAPFIRTPDTSSPKAPISLSASSAATDARFAAWLKAVEQHGNSGPGAGFVCAHQMGTNRMSARPKDGVVDPTGKVWGTKGLYVSDSSVFPSASGVNPMITNMAISDWISRGMAAELEVEARDFGTAARL